MSNSVFKALTVLTLLGHAGALTWAVGLGRGDKPAVLLNLCLACAVLGYWIDKLSQVANADDYLVMGLIGFELVTAGTSILVLCERRVPALVIWLQFSGHFLFTAVLTIFALTFKMTRLM